MSSPNTTSFRKPPREHHCPPSSVVSPTTTVSCPLCAPSLNVDPFLHGGVYVHVASHLDHGRVNNINSRVLSAHLPGTVLNLSIGVFASSLVAPIGSILSPITTIKPRQKNNKTQLPEGTGGDQMQVEHAGKLAITHLVSHFHGF